MLSVWYMCIKLEEWGTNKANMQITHSPACKVKRFLGENFFQVLKSLGTKQNHYLLKVLLDNKREKNNC